MKKIVLSLFALLLIPLTQASQAPLFSDLTSDDPDFEVVSAFHERGLFSGVNGEAQLESPLVKAHGVMLVMKLLGKDPDLAEAQKMGLISSVPTANQSLSKAEWMVILSRAFKIPLEAQEGQAWFDPAFKLGQNLKLLTREDDPHSIVNRGLALRSAHKFETVFKVQIQQGLIVKVEQELMTIRDALLNPDATALEVEASIWSSIAKLKDIDPAVVPLARLESLRAYQMSFLVLYQMRFHAAESVRSVRQSWASMQIEKAVRHLPASEGFANDLRFMAGLATSSEVPPVYNLGRSE